MDLNICQYNKPECLKKKTKEVHLKRGRYSFDAVLCPEHEEEMRLWFEFLNPELPKNN